MYDQSKKITESKKKIRIKTKILRSDLCNYSDVYIAVKGYAAVTNLDYAKSVASKKMHHLSTEF